MTYAITAPGWEALGWTLIHFFWQAALIAVLYRLADAVLSKAQSQIRYVAALTALLSMLAVATGTLVYEATRSAQDRIAASRWQEQQNFATQTSSAPTATAGQSAPTTSDPGVPLLAAVHNAALTELQQEMRGAMPWLDAIWLFGVLCLSTRTVGGWWMIQRLRRTSLARVPQHVLESFSRLSLRFGIRRTVDLRISTRITSPLAMGVLKSVVLLPASALTSLSPEQLEVVLAHELAHIRRADYLWNMLQTVIETLFFFHPAVWWVSRNLREQRELCCDDAALACCADPLTYATALLCLEEERRSRPILALALDGHESSGLRNRIGRILGETPRSGRDVTPFSLLGVCAMLGLVLLSAPRLLADLSPVDTVTKEQASTPGLPTVVAEPHVSKAAGDPKADSQPAPSPAPAPKASAVAVVAPAPRVAPVPPAPPETDVPDPACAPAAPEPMASVIAAAPPAEFPVKINVRPATLVLALASARAMAQQGSTNPASKGDYIDQMRAAGYNVDLDKYVAMKIQGVTPEFARSMASTGFGKPSADDLIAMKIHGVDPSEVAELKAAGIQPGSYQDLITYRIFKVSPEFVTGMKAAGFNNISAKKLVELRIQGVTPEFAKSTKQQWPDATVDQLVQLRIFNINDAFIASAKRHGLEPLTIEKLLRLRISGILDDETPKSENSK